MAVYSITTEGERACAAATIVSPLGLYGSTTAKPRLIEWGLSFDGVSSIAEPAYVRLVRVTTAGTWTTAATEIQWDIDDIAPIAAGQILATAQPTKSSVLAIYEVHTQGGSLVIQYPLGREPRVNKAANAGIVIEVTSPTLVNCVAYMVWEEA